MRYCIENLANRQVIGAGVGVEVRFGVGVGVGVGVWYCCWLLVVLRGLNSNLPLDHNLRLEVFQARAVALK